MPKLHFRGSASRRGDGWVTERGHPSRWHRHREHRPRAVDGVRVPSRALAAALVPLFENVTNLDRLPAEGFHVVAPQMKIEGGSGGPLRAMAIVGR